MVLYVDGGCSGNDQRDMTKRRMVAVVTDDTGVVLSERRETGGSNNIAELMAVHDALVWATSQYQHDVEARTDSRNNLSWVNGKKVGKSVNDRATVLDLRVRIATLRQRVCLTLTWVPRDENKAGQYIEGTYSL
jgi:ribonuclease HI